MFDQVTLNRLGSLRDLVRNQGLDGLLVAGPDNRRYLSGFTAREELVHESCGFLLITAKAALLFTDFRYQEWAQAEASDYEVVVYQAGLGVALAEQIAVLGLKRLGFESAYLTFAQHQRLRQAVVEAHLQVEWEPVEGLVESLREVKTPEEVAAIRRALALTEAVFEEVAAGLRPGLTESQVAWEIERRLREESAEVLAFPPIVAAGPNAARPHHRPGDYVLRQGEPIIIDMGARREGYCADLTRTVILGPPTDRFREIYTLVRQAQKRAEAGLMAGMDSVAADALAREVIREGGHGPAFGHSLGHGVGLAVHELPSLSPLEERRTTLKAGSVVTIEPGIYLSGWGGVRLENMALIREDGAEILNRLGFLEF
uniref:Aminopeptidase P family protein n=1 Tax=Desulfobacca acetoxidans TaxID=60893 RepID=A0A7V4LE44_9BACT